ncbi:MAG: heparan-alpha-glucosaminide N-acetyltransferase domain-containing protein [Acidobacteriia bacterium]|nr:heparan-alpha-glucosaminide N-acetyltransferase domain-containing protein [Terriglobia bacterium]
MLRTETVVASRQAPAQAVRADRNETPRGARVQSIDIVRGAVMLLMAIDHVRVYCGLPAGGPTPGIFLTRWITHFVAPAFIFLAGTSAFLHGRKLADTRALARFLVTRGLWLVLLELTVLRVAWTFNFDFGHYLLAGVIWGIGWCMVLLAGLIFLPTRALVAFGLIIVLGHNILDRSLPSLYAMLQTSHWSWLWQVLYFGGPIQIGEHGPILFVLYSIFPWIGVMALGYVFGRVMITDELPRRRMCLALGAACIVAFLVLRGFNLYGDPRPWVAPAHPPSVQGQTAPHATSGAPASAASPATQQAAPVTPPRRPQAPAWISFLNTTKYPASLLFLLMTLGPMLLVLPLLENAGGRVTSVLKIFGRVPFFYYMLHIPLIHFAAIIVSLLRTGSVAPWLFMNHPVMNPPSPPGYVWNLALLYLVWLIVVAVLYVPCRWFAGLKQRRKDIGFLSYL